MSVKKYSVIEFPSSGGKTKPVEVIPTKFQDRTVYWPPNSLVPKLESIVRKGEELPGPAWKLCAFERILGQYDDYYIALAKLRKSFDTSNLDSESDASPPNRVKRGTKQKRKNNRKESRSSSSNDENSENFLLPPPPPPSSISGTRPSSKKGPTLILADPPGGHFSGSSVTQAVDVDGNFGQNSHSATAIPLPPFESSILDLPLDQEEIEDPSLSIATAADVASLKLMITEFATKVYTQLAKLTTELSDLKATRSTGSLPDFTQIPSLPIDDEEKLKDFESWLDLNENRDTLVNYISSIGGGTQEKNTRRVLKRLISPALSRRINFTGKGDKIALKNLKIFKTIQDGVKKGNPDAKEDTVEKAAIDWFRYSKGRVKDGI